MDSKDGGTTMIQHSPWLSKKEINKHTLVVVLPLQTIFKVTLSNQPFVCLVFIK